MTHMGNENSDRAMERPPSEAHANLLPTKKKRYGNSGSSSVEKKVALPRVIDGYLKDICPGSSYWSPPFDEIFKRIQEGTGETSQTGLGRKLHMSQTGVREAIVRRSIPDAWYMKLAENFGLNPLYLKWGLEPKQLLPDGGGIAPFTFEPPTPAQVLLSLFKDILPPELAETAVSKIYITSDMLTEILPDILRRILPNDLAELVISNMDCKKLFR